MGKGTEPWNVIFILIALKNKKKNATSKPRPVNMLIFKVDFRLNFILIMARYTQVGPLNLNNCYVTVEWSLSRIFSGSTHNKS